MTQDDPKRPRLVPPPHLPDKITVMLILSFLLAILLTGAALGNPVVNAAAAAAAAGPFQRPRAMPWGPTGRLFWRCRSPFLVEVSDDRRRWVPSSACLEGTCCSSLAGGPLCSRDACGLVPQEEGPGRGPGAQVALGATRQRAPRGPVAA